MDRHSLLARRSPWVVPMMALLALLPSVVAGASDRSQKLNARLPTKVSGDVHEFAGSPDGSRVVFSADLTGDGVRRLFSAPSRGGVRPVELSGALTPGGS